MSAKSNHEPESAAAELCCVVALDCEARPLIDALGLKRRQDCQAWPVFADAEARRWLIVSGVGRSASAGACGFLAAYCGQARHATWLNAGIAGHPSLELGDLRRAAKVTDAATDRSWYPPEVTRAAPPAQVLTTVDRPSSDYPGGGLVDMEAAGFYSVASRFASREYVQVVKVVSDNAEQNFEKTINARQVRRWIGDATPAILDYAEALRQLACANRDRNGNRAALAASLMAGRPFRFTATQQRQFCRLLERLDALGGIDEAAIEQLWGDAGSSREALRLLERDAAERPLCLG